MNNEVRVGIIGSVDSGKCFAKDTPIMMSDGSLKMVQDIMIGDTLMGDDFKSRRVLTLSSGKSTLFKVKQTNGDDYIVNSNHILCLYSEVLGKVINMSLYSYLLSKTKNKLKGIRIFRDGSSILSDLNIETLSEDKYYGFGVDKNHRFLLGDSTITHNSTITGVLTKNILDDGRGKARSYILKHPHEKESGRTSCVSQHYIREFNEEGGERVVNFVDLAGHEKYLKTTIMGLSKCLVDYTGIVVAANMGVLCMTREHINIVMALNIPSFIILTKIDMAPEHILKDTLKKLDSLFGRYKKKRTLMKIENDSDYKSFLKIDDKKTTIPIFYVSSVKGTNVDILREYILNLKPLIPYDEYIDKEPHFLVESRFRLKGIGLVVSGVMKSGVIKKNDVLSIGPIDKTFKKIVIKSIHNNFQEDVEKLESGHGGSFSIKVLNSKDQLKRNMIRKGIHILQNPKLYWRFEADVLILHHPTTIKVNYQPLIHCGNVSQTSEIYEMSKDCLRIGDKASVKFKFKYRPEYIIEGTKIIFREGRSKGVGIITKILND